MNNDTPRTDAWLKNAYDGHEFVEHCRELEAELAEAKELISQLREQRKCECSETDACRFAKERDEAKELLEKWVDPTLCDDECLWLKEQTEEFLERSRENERHIL